MSAAKLWVLGFVLAFVGCSEAKIPVSGTVTYQDKPLPDVNVVMVRDDGVVATAVTGTDGRFENVTSESPNDGALAGTYSVGITPVSEVPGDAGGAEDYGIPTQPPFPPKYLSGETSGLEVTVEEGMAPVTLQLD